MSTATNHQPTAKNIGHVTQVIGSTFDVEFAEEQLPAIFNAVKISAEHKGIKVSLTGDGSEYYGAGSDTTVLANVQGSGTLAIAGGGNVVVGPNVAVTGGNPPTDTTAPTIASIATSGSLTRDLAASRRASAASTRSSMPANSRASR